MGFHACVSFFDKHSDNSSNSSSSSSSRGEGEGEGEGRIILGSDVAATTPESAVHITEILFFWVRKFSPLLPDIISPFDRPLTLISVIQYRRLNVKSQMATKFSL